MMSESGSPLQQSGAAAEQGFTRQGEDAVTVDCRKLTWIEIELLDDRDHPLQEEDVLITDPLGRTHQITTDDEGVARLDWIPAGNCIVAMPSYESGQWEPPAQPAVTPEPEDEPSWVEIEVLDEAGNGIPGQEVSVAGPHGDEYSATTDENGIARVDGVVAGTCALTFVGTDSDMLELV